MESRRAGRPLRDILAKEAVIDNYEVTHDFPALGQAGDVLNARKLWSEGNPASLILLAIEDVTSRKQTEEEPVALKRRRAELCRCGGA